jgi:S-adenosylmethionine/arginine decarboxylase-like enzyme
MLVVLVVIVVSHLNFHTHPRVDAALKEMFAF